MRLKNELFWQFSKPVIKLWARLDNVVVNAIRGMCHEALCNGTQLQHRSKAGVCVCFVLHQRDAYTYVLSIFDFILLCLRLDRVKAWPMRNDGRTSLYFKIRGRDSADEAAKFCPATIATA
jgi:hypothetical protein